MQTTLNHEIKVGLFAAVGVVLFCLSIVLLGGDKFFFASRYTLKIQLSQVQGITKGSVVTVTGLKVGNVDSVDFLPNSSEMEVTVSIQESIQSRITEGSKASVKTQGALGDKYIYIEPGPIGSKPLLEGATLETDRSPDFLDIIAAKGAEMGEVVEVIKEVRILFQNINHDGRSAKLMQNLVESSGEISKTMAETRETMRLLRSEAIVPLASVMQKIDRGQGTLGALVNDSSLHTRISEMVGSSPHNNFLKPLLRESIQTNERKN